MGKELRRDEGRMMICVCCMCGDARDDIASDGTWHDLDAHLVNHSLRHQSLEFTHSFCPSCFARYKKSYALEMKNIAYQEPRYAHN